MAIEISTAGILVRWAIGASGTTHPTGSGVTFASLRGVKEIDDFNPEPSTIQVTPLEETAWHRYIPGLRDAGGPKALTVNDYKDFRDDWNALMTAYSTKQATDALWIEYYVPQLDSQGVTDCSFYYTATPSELGFAGASVDEAFDNQPYLTPNYVEGWAAKSA